MSLKYLFQQTKTPPELSEQTSTGGEASGCEPKSRLIPPGGQSALPPQSKCWILTKALVFGPGPRESFQATYNPPLPSDAVATWACAGNPLAWTAPGRAVQLAEARETTSVRPRPASARAVRSSMWRSMGCLPCVVWRAVDAGR